MIFEALGGVTKFYEASTKTHHQSERMKKIGTSFSILNFLIEMVSMFETDQKEKLINATQKSN